VTEAQVTKWWDYWTLYRMAGKKIEIFALLVDWKGPLSRSMLDTFFELDYFMDKMEKQKMKQESKRNKK
jgi:hypothetical protein